jgi:hypothetical protein
MGMAIGVMGSYIDGGVSAAINLRNDREASLIFISPPPPEKLKAQGSAFSRTTSRQPSTRPTMQSSKHWKTWLGLPLLAVSGAPRPMGLEHGQRGPCRSPAQSARRRSEANAAALQRRPREYVLEVIGLGVSLDKHRQGKLWDALQKGHPFGTIREQDPEKYPWSERQGWRGGRLPRPWRTASAACHVLASPIFCNRQLIESPSAPRQNSIPPSAR